MRISPLLLIVAAGTGLAACDASPPPAIESSALSAAPPVDFVDARGTRWKWQHEVTPLVVDVGKLEQMQKSLTPPPDNQPDYLSGMTETELAAKLSPKMLRRVVDANGAVSFHEYGQETAPLAMAHEILAMRGTSTSRDSNAGTGVAASNGAAASPDRVGRFIIGTDDRTYASGNKFNWPFRTASQLGQVCTQSMIGTNTALSAAHCFYNDTIPGGPWISTTVDAAGADTVAPTQPFGNNVFTYIIIPGNWNHPGDWDWDFAALDYNIALGNTTGWLGWDTADPGTSPLLRMHGYPNDKPYPQLWNKDGKKIGQTGARYKHNADVIPGDSGACLYRVDSSRCIGNQSTQWSSGGVLWNEVRKFDNTTLSFLHMLPHGGI